MEFLSIKDTNYADKKQGMSSKDQVNIILSVANQGLEVKEQTKLNDFIGGLTEEHSRYFSKVLKAKTSGQEKAIISALLNKYKNLYSNEAEKREFREHLANMLKSDKLTDGALKYMLERILSKDSDENPKKKEKPEGQVQEPENGQPEEGSGPEGEDEGEGEGQPAQAAAPAQDTNNSASDFYSDWEDEFNDDNLTISEEEFDDLIDNDEIKSLLGEDKVYSSAKDFLREKLINQAKEVTYSSRMIAEDFIFDKLFLKH